MIVAAQSARMRPRGYSNIPQIREPRSSSGRTKKFDDE